MAKLSPFHLAIPVSDLNESKKFYEEILGCSPGRFSEEWADYDFFGHQLVIHVDPNHKSDPHHNEVDGKSVPIPHFGVVVPWDEFDIFSKKLKENGNLVKIESIKNRLKTAKKFGEDKVLQWRRSFNIQPPLASENSEFDPNNDDLYKGIDIELPRGESLEDVVSRVEKTLETIIDKAKNNNVLVVAHGNSIRAILKIVEDISDKDIVNVNIPTGIPLAFNVQDDKVSKIGYLGEQEQIKKLQKEVEQQSRITKG